MMLRDFNAGDTVILKGAISTAKPAFIGEIDGYGRYRLWANQGEFSARQPWIHDAAGSHGAERGAP